jgi:hypothetical protein
VELLVILSVICGVCLCNIVLILTNMIQISNGSYLFDTDAPIGIKIRKWFFVAVGISNFFRFSSSLIAVFWILRGSFTAMQILTLSTMSDLCSFFHLAVFSYAADYLCRIYHSLNGLHASAFQYFWLGFNILAFTAVLCWNHLIPLTMHVSNYLTIVQILYPSVILSVILFYGYFTVKSLFGTGYSNSMKIIARFLVVFSIIIFDCILCISYRTIFFYYYPRFPK